ncbi:MAG: hypothetical protein AUI14_09650 [Actinobacteria bacterium 13_2_20CM_2_71_6]|nr:MAG: hypothetical protein AUI14_09650 [Actinobacteria bacterium 13_2_20CM_2_71_6]
MVSYNEPVAQRRPGTVSAAGYLMFLVAALIVINGIITLVTLGPVIDATRKAYASLPNADAVGSAAQVVTVILVVVTYLFAAGFVILGLLDLRGKNAARIVTWVLAGLSVLCFGCGAIGGATGGFGGGLGRGNTNGVDITEATRQINDAYPAWFKPTSLAITVINLLAVLAVIILLALPASNGYFRRGKNLADPAIPSLPYPPPPGYQAPGYQAPGSPPPGYQPPGSEPPYPPAPGTGTPPPQ